MPSKLSLRKYVLFVLCCFDGFRAAVLLGSVVGDKSNGICVLVRMDAFTSNSMDQSTCMILEHYGP